jgi:serine/threonine-protein kinase
MSDAEDPLLGREVGRYRITRLLGAGGMGRVYEATQAESGAVVAIKIVAERYASDATLIERFFAEARAANLIAHENIVKVHDLAQLPDGRPYIVMERLFGNTLRELITESPLPIGGLLQVAIEVLAALAATHRAGIIHRDLKPDNIFVTTKGRAKVLDFGIAKLSGANAIARTQTGVVLGTPEYMAPEHIIDGATDARSDLYSLGVVLFEALAGRRPFVAATDFELMRAHVEREPPRVRSLRADVPAALDDAIDRVLAKHPKQRFASASSMANALRHVASLIPVEEWRPVVPGGRLASPRPPNQPPQLEPSGVQRPPTLPTVANRPRVRQPLRSRRWLPIAGALAIAMIAGAVVATRALHHEEPDGVVAAAERVVVAAPVTSPSPADAPSPVAMEPPTVPPKTDDVGRRTRRSTVDAGVVDAAAAPIVNERVAEGAFDWRAYIPTAHAQARKRAADAIFIGLDLHRVTPDGEVSFDRGVTYMFGSATLPKGECAIYVSVSKRGTTVELRKSNCASEVKPPRCAVRQVREKVRVIDARMDSRVLAMSFGTTGWLVAGDGLGDSWTVADDCTATRWTSPRTDIAERTQVSRELTAEEYTTFDMRTFVPAARLFARELNLHANLGRIVVALRETTYKFTDNGSCIEVKVRGRTLDARRVPKCDVGHGGVGIHVPKCSVTQLFSKLKRDGVLEWDGHIWTSVGAPVVTFEDDC